MPAVVTVLVCLVLSAAALSDPAAVLESAFSARDIPLDPDPTREEWADAPRVVARVDRAGQPIPGPPTEIRSRWTREHLYLLYICPYTELNLKPDPVPTAETSGLWNWDVAEAFIGSDFERIGRYKEFQVSPQSEWVDLDIDRDNRKSNRVRAGTPAIRSRARIDTQAHVWYGMMRIPFAAIDARPPEKGRELRIGLFRISGAESQTAPHLAGDRRHHVSRTRGASVRSGCVEDIQRCIRSESGRFGWPPPCLACRGALGAVAGLSRRWRAARLFRDLYR